MPIGEKQGELEKLLDPIPGFIGRFKKSHDGY